MQSQQKMKTLSEKKVAPIEKPALRTLKKLLMAKMDWQSEFQIWKGKHIFFYYRKKGLSDI
jgi:hypothetical protein